MATRRPRKTTAKPSTSNTKKTTTTTSKKTTTKKSPVKKTTTRKTTATKKTTAKKPTTRKTTTTKKSSSVVKKEYEYVRVSENSRNTKFNEVGQKVQSGELQWAYYAIDGNVGYHYYRKLK